MVLTLIISILTLILLILAILFKPSIRFGKYTFESFWIVALLGALLLIICQCVPFQIIKENLLTNSPINPLKLLIILLGMAFLSITLDELGFFNLIAIKAISYVKNSQIKLFLLLYVLVSFLTIFTSNDIIILTFTLFISYFCKKTKINPIPYLVMEFVAANTYSMIFIIGNPTNIFLAQAYSIDFLGYFKIMALPTIMAGLSSLITLFLLFRKELKKPLNAIEMEEVKLHSKPLTVITLVLLGLSTFFLAVSNYLHIEMFIISIIAILLLFLVLTLFSIVTRSYTLSLRVFRRLPYNLVAFVTSMFILVISLDHYDVFNQLSSFFNMLCISKESTIFTYGIASSLSCNLINNIPMSLAFSKIIGYGNPVYLKEMIYSTIIGSNLGAILSPIGALAGIMWMNILKKQEINFSFVSFIKYGLILLPIILLQTLLGLLIVL